MAQRFAHASRLILGLLLEARTPTDRAGDKPLDKIQEMRANLETFIPCSVKLI